MNDFGGDENIIQWPATIAQGFLNTVKTHPDMVAAFTVGCDDALTWQQVQTRVSQVAVSLQKLGIGHGDTVGLLLKNRPEFLIADLATMCLGAAPFSIYVTSPPAQIIPILDNSDCKVLVCEQDFLQQALDSVKAAQQSIQVVVLEGNVPGTIAWQDLLVDDERFDLAASVATVTPEDLGGIVYTSGTTGAAKGVELTHGGLVELVRVNNLCFGLFPGQCFFSWLPTAGMADRIVSYYQPLLIGGTIAYCTDTHQAASDVAKVAPNFLFAPPRFWEKIREAIEISWRGLPHKDQILLAELMPQCLQRADLELEGSPVTDNLNHAYQIANERFFAPVRKKFGLDASPCFLMSGGAAASVELLRFLYAVGLPVEECYGMTESCALGTRNPHLHARLGSVGKAQPGIELKLADDGEILIRSKAMMRSYRKRPEATAEAIDRDGWLHTGDLARVDEDGFYYIIGRKKEMMINSFGKNMSPVNIEAALTNAGPFISQAAVIGDGRRYNVALLTLNAEHVKMWAKEKGLPNSTDITVLSKDPQVLAEVSGEVNRANEQLARVEQLKKFHVVSSEWLPGSDVLTATMKLKRSVIDERYKADIESMYND